MDISFATRKLERELLAIAEAERCAEGAAGFCWNGAQVVGTNR
jgi:hypothetical protein